MKRAFGGILCYFALLLLASASVAISISGCGSSSSTVSAVSGIATTKSKATGSASFTITWPERAPSTRLIPYDANSIVITIQSNAGTGSVVPPKYLVRPDDFSTTSTSTVEFNPLNLGSYTVTATAYPSKDCTGTAQAAATMVATIMAGPTTNVKLTMGSTIDHLSVTAPLPQLVIGTQETPVVTAYDVSGSIVMLSISAEEITWAVASETSMASIDPVSGLVTAGSSTGAITVTATDKETITAANPQGKSGNVTIMIVAPPVPDLPTSGVLIWERETSGSSNDSSLYLYRFGAGGPATPVPLPANTHNMLNPEFDGGDGSHFLSYAIVGSDYDIFDYNTTDLSYTDLTTDPSFGIKCQDAKFDSTGTIMAYTSVNPNTQLPLEPKIYFFSLTSTPLPAGYPTGGIYGREPTFLPDGSGFAYLVDTYDSTGTIMGTSTTAQIYTFADGKSRTIDVSSSYENPSYLVRWGSDKLMLTVHRTSGISNTTQDDDLIAVSWKTLMVTDTFDNINSSADESDPAPIDDYRFFFARTVPVAGNTSKLFRIFLADTRLNTVRQIDEITAPDTSKQDLGLSYTKRN